VREAAHQPTHTELEIQMRMRRIRASNVIYKARSDEALRKYAIAGLDEIRRRKEQQQFETQSQLGLPTPVKEDDGW
jgi:hypothetical protein